MAVTTPALAAAVVPEKWELDVMRVNYAEKVIASRMKQASEMLLSSGDIYHFPSEDELTVGTVSTSGDFDTQTLDPVDNTVTVDQWKYVAFEIGRNTKAQANVDLKSQYSPSAGKALAAHIDGLVAANATLIPQANWVGSPDSSSQFKRSQLLAGLLKMADLNLKTSDLNLFLPPIAFYDGIWTEDAFVAANQTGLPKSVLTNGFKYPLLGVPVYETTKLALTGNAYNAILAHKEWVGVVQQIKMEWESASGIAAKKATMIHFLHTLMGHGILRSTFAVRLFINASSTVQ